MNHIAAFVHRDGSTVHGCVCGVCVCVCVGGGGGVHA